MMPPISDEEHRENIKQLEAIRAEIKFESQMLSSRLSAYLSSQSFLIIAYGSSMASGWSKPGIFTLLVPLPLTILGLVLSMDAWKSLKVSMRVIEDWHGRQNELLGKHSDLAAFWPSEHSEGEFYDPALITRFQQGSSFAKRSPWIFAVTWVYFALIAATLYLRG
jgi:hypothetical protein